MAAMGKTALRVQGVAGDGGRYHRQWHLMIGIKIVDGLIDRNAASPDQLIYSAGLGKGVHNAHQLVMLRVLLRKQLFHIIGRVASAANHQQLHTDPPSPWHIGTGIVMLYFYHTTFCV